MNIDGGAQGTLSASTQYVMSGWYATSDDYNGGDTMFHARAYSTGGSHNATGNGIGTLLYSVEIGGLTWEYRYQTITTPSDYSGNFDWYMGYGTTNTTGYRYYTGLKVEEGSFPSLLDLSRNGNDAKIINGTSYSSANGGSLVFDGSDDYGDLGTFFTFTNFTISLWVYPGSTQVQYADIFDNNHSSTRNFVCQQDNLNTNQYEFICFDATNNSRTSAFTLTANTWHYLTFTWNNSVASGYINGVFHSSGSAVNPINYVSPNLKLADWNNGGRNWNGRMSNFMVHNRVLTASEIQQNFNATRGRYGI